jgi:hypothetical protein
MRYPHEYKTDFGLYKATIKILESYGLKDRPHWLRNALYECEKNHPELYPQLKNIIYPGTKVNIEDLDRTNNILETL